MKGSKTSKYFEEELCCRKSVLHLNLVYLLLIFERFQLTVKVTQHHGGEWRGYSCIHFACAELCS